MILVRTKAEQEKVIATWKNIFAEGESQVNRTSPSDNQETNNQQTNTPPKTSTGIMPLDIDLTGDGTVADDEKTLITQMNLVNEMEKFDGDSKDIHVNVFDGNTEKKIDWVKSEMTNEDSDLDYTKDTKKPPSNIFNQAMVSYLNANPSKEAELVKAAQEIRGLESGKKAGDLSQETKDIAVAALGHYKKEIAAKEKAVETEKIRSFLVDNYDELKKANSDLIAKAD